MTHNDLFVADIVDGAAGDGTTRWMRSISRWEVERLSRHQLEEAFLALAEAGYENAKTLANYADDLAHAADEARSCIRDAVDDLAYQLDSIADELLPYETENDMIVYDAVKEIVTGLRNATYD